MTTDFSAIYRRRENRHYKKCARPIDPMSWFMTIFESRGPHGRGELWNTRDTRVNKGVGLRENKNPMSCVRRLHYD
jgi:hypothetical protein